MASAQFTSREAYANHILKNGVLVRDIWIFPEDNDVLSGVEDGNSVAVNYERWLSESDFRLNYNGNKGVVLNNTNDVSQLEPELARLDLICIDFPLAVDGRGYSQAHLLRNRYQFKGELRAIGEVLVDQIFLMERCGINAYALQDSEDLIQSARFLKPFSISYQSSKFRNETVSFPTEN